MSRLSVTSSNSLRRTSPSLRKRAQSLGRLGELAEGETYEYQELNEANRRNCQPVLDWGTRSRLVHSESGSPADLKKSFTLNPSDSRTRSKSIHEATVFSKQPVLMPRDILISPRTVPEQLGFAKSIQRPVSCLYSTYSENNGAKLISEQPKMETQRRPQSTYNFKVCQVIYLHIALM